MSDLAALKYITKQIIGAREDLAADNERYFNKIIIGAPTVGHDLDLDGYCRKCSYHDSEADNGCEPDLD